MDLHVFPISIPSPTSLSTHPSGSSQCTRLEHLSHVHLKLLYASVQNGVCFIKLMQRVDDVINVKYLDQWKELNKLVVTFLLVNEIIRIAPL